MPEVSSTPSADEVMRNAPVADIGDSESLHAAEQGIALCLSGGGYRAMVFHLGALWRLYECGLLGQAKRVSSVSGGSITAAVLALAWDDLPKDAIDIDAFQRLVVAPVRRLAGVDIDVGAVIKGVLPFVKASDGVERAYDEHLFHGRTLQDLPDEPRFVINATNVQSGRLWRFSRPYMGDWQVGRVMNPTVSLAKAVAASSAFPPVLSPSILKLDPARFAPGSGDGLQHEPYTREVWLTDGGVYDNLGLETAFKRYHTLFVSDGGGRFAPDPEPASSWGLHTKRVLDVIDNQVRSLRKRQLVGAFTSEPPLRGGAYWSMWTDIDALARRLPSAKARREELARVATRLDAMPAELQQRLVNLGYAVSDACIRAYHDPDVAPPPAYPYPETGI